MINTLRGALTEKTLTHITIECAGVGYGVLTTTTDASALQVGQEAKLYIHEHIKEDAHDLYGFAIASTKQLFEQLLSVKNVGPKVALSVLDLGPSDHVRAIIAGGNVKSLQTAKGVGKRAAEQIVVELRDKIGAPTGGAADLIANRASVNTGDEAVQALIALGYSDIDAQAALAAVDPALSVEERIKAALRTRI